MSIAQLAPWAGSDVLKAINPVADNPVNSLNKAMIKPTAATTLILPWPDKTLSPNRRVHWAKRAQAVKSARYTAFILARKSGWTHHYVQSWVHYQSINKNSIDYLTRRYNLILDFYPPNKRRRDDDNLIASFKPYRDGIAQALNIDDFRFRTVATVREEVIKNGRVKIGISINKIAL